MTGLTFEVMLHRLTRPWPVEKSAKIAGFALVLVSLYTLEMTRRALGPNAGYYEIGGIPSTSFAAVHLAGVLAVSLIAIYLRYREKPTRRYRQIGKRLALGIVVLAVIEAVWIIPHGQHVIVI